MPADLRRKWWRTPAHVWRTVSRTAASPSGWPHSPRFHAGFARQVRATSAFAPSPSCRAGRGLPGRCFPLFACSPRTGLPSRGLRPRVAPVVLQSSGDRFNPLRCGCSPTTSEPTRSRATSTCSSPPIASGEGQVSTGVALDSRTGWTRWVVARLICHAPRRCAARALGLEGVLRARLAREKGNALTIADLLSIVFRCCAACGSVQQQNRFFGHRLPPLSSGSKD